MHEVLVALKPESPLRIGGVKVSASYLDTLTYLPGSALRGALAEWLIRNGRQGQILPTVQKMRFGNLFPSPTEGVYALPFPLTALECKGKGGFFNVPRDRHEEKGHGIRDALLISVTYQELERKGVTFPVPMALRCRACKGRMERVSGFYARLPEGWVKVKPETAMQTKVALSRHRRAAQEAMLYRVIAIRPQSYFVGRLWIESDADLDLLKEAVRTLGVGALTTRGFGKAELHEVPSSLPSVRERIQHFNEKLQEVWRQLADLAKQVGFHAPEKPEGIYFSVDLLSPAVLHDAQGIPTLRLQLNLNGQTLKPVFWATQPALVGGWSTAWGLPKPTALGAAMGSVYVFRTEKSLDEIAPLLEALEAQGVGDRTDEGLGEILICHPFHLEVMAV
jgi:CRISPR-associated protein Csx10